MSSRTPFRLLAHTRALYRPSPRPQLVDRVYGSRQRAISTSTSTSTSTAPKFSKGFLGLHRGRSPLVKTGKLPKSERGPAITVYSGPPSARERCKDPLAAVATTQLAQLDPNGARRRLFDRANPEVARACDILLVRQTAGEPFAGVCMSIKRRGVDTAILLRNQLTRVGVEMWFKVFSPNVRGVEIVQRAQRKARRARLTYLRLRKHDRGSVENIVTQYQRQRAALRSGGGGGASSDAKGRDASAHKRGAVKQS